MKWVLRKKVTKQNKQQVSLLFKVLKNSQSHPKLEKILRQTPSSTYTTKEIEEEAEAEDTGSETRQIKGESSRTNKCVMA